MLTIGQLARAFHISTKTLRHYETIGLFQPSKIGDDNQYRYYSMDQLTTLRNILYLRQLGLGLEVIRGLQESSSFDDPQRIGLILQEHAERIRCEIKQKQLLLKNVEEMTENIMKWGKIVMEPKVIMVPEMTVVGMEYLSTNTEDSIPEMWDRLIPREDEIQHKVNPKVSYGICCFEENGTYSYLAGFQVSSTEDVPAGMISKLIPEQKMACFTHTGPTRMIKDSFTKAFASLAHFQLEPAKGYDFELYDERFLTPEHEETQIDLYIPIK
ncbi:MAG: MerR family transcriptional regulator [Clostridia bacterium]